MALFFFGQRPISRLTGQVQSQYFKFPITALTRHWVCDAPFPFGSSVRFLGALPPRVSLDFCYPDDFDSLGWMAKREAWRIVRHKHTLKRFRFHHTFLLRFRAIPLFDFVNDFELFHWFSPFGSPRLSSINITSVTGADLASDSGYLESRNHLSGNRVYQEFGRAKPRMPYTYPSFYASTPKHLSDMQWQWALRELWRNWTESNRQMRTLLGYRKVWILRWNGSCREEDSFWMACRSSQKKW